MSNFAIKVENLGKLYQIGELENYYTLRDSLTNIVKYPFKLISNNHESKKKPEIEYIWALKDINFEVKHGEIVGIIGRNGAGKSTLLKILSRITTPTEGRVIINGRVGSLLEVGTGFHPELTGRENIYLNGSILGMSKKEIEGKFDEIVDFAEIEKFLDTPVKRYSSGMYVRLAFGVAAHMEPEILIIDEVLTVGDIAFQKKCLSKMDNVSKDGKTILIVSHNMSLIRKLCTRGLLITNGKINNQGDIEELISTYLENILEKKENEGEIFIEGNDINFINNEIRLNSVRLDNLDGEVKSKFSYQEYIRISINYNLFNQITGLRMILSIINQEGIIAFTTSDSHLRHYIDEPGNYLSTCILPNYLFNDDEYTINIAFNIPGVRRIIPSNPVINFSISNIGFEERLYAEKWPGVVCPKIDWQINKI